MSYTYPADVQNPMEMSRPEEPLRRYVLFAGDAYYTDGGALDIKKSYSNLEEAIEAARELLVGVTPDYLRTWAHVLDIQTGRIVVHSSGDHSGRTEHCEILAPAAVDLTPGDPRD